MKTAVLDAGRWTLGWAACSRELSPLHFILLNLVLGVGHFVSILSAGAYLPMLPYVAGSIGEGLAYAVWGQSNYFIAMGAAFLLARPLMARLGARDAAISAYVLFAFASLLVLLSTRYYPIFTFARTLQGLAAGLSLSPSLALLLDQYKKSHQKVAVSLWSLAVFAPFSIGPALGGFFAYKLGDWRWLFVVSFAASLCVAVFLWALTERPEAQKMSEVPPLAGPWRSFLLFGGAAIALQEFFDVGLISDMTSNEYGLWWIGSLFVLFATLFCIHNRHATHPILKTAIFRYPNFRLGFVILCLAFIGLQSSIVQYLIRLQTVEGFTAWHAGLLFLPLFAFSKPLNLWAQHLLHRGYDPRLLATVAFVGLAASFWWMSLYARPATWETLLWPQFLEGAALGLLFISLNHIALSNVPDAEQLHGIDVLNAFRNMAAGLAITISDITWDHYLARHRNYLNGPDAALSQNYFDAVLQSGDMPAAAIRHEMHAQASLQSGLLNLNAMFHFLGMYFLALAAMVWLVRSRHILHKDKKLEQIVESLGEEP
ncbi:MFS transporter, DHA2 family, multidrug resistance protein [Novimethylophilus kurashikiensis]|uniref:MFS transporter, DHA2 family, multidrug resistance protein n=1 Tax=Novimethylophilus kurashikiensis TaxID=1825523 RepID=A0A2R5F648_9PROT|nr:MFS transporter [Novimethylophilus kurashikiensis]GBG13068.1 MFS transporter, DHA2 family, multidrug resistance protein [Novimethylophilus kurashikiensis]